MGDDQLPADHNVVAFPGRNRGRADGGDEVSKRWRAEIHYRTELGNLTEVRQIEELSEIEDIVEKGPDWNCIALIEITLARVNYPGSTIEEAERR